MNLSKAGVAAILVASLLAAGVTPTLAQSPDTTAARRLLAEVATGMGGAARLGAVGNVVYTGFGQQVYQDGGGNITGDVEAPPKWRGIVDAQRSIDLTNRRAILQQRRSNLFPFAAPFGLNWDRVATPQEAAELLDHPLPALRSALDADATLGPVGLEEGRPVLQFTTREGTTAWMGIDPTTRLPAWTRRLVPHANLGDVAVTTHFTGYVPHEGIALPFGLMQRIDWRGQVTLMFQVDSYRLDVPTAQLPEFPPKPASRPAEPAPRPVITPLHRGVWDVRVGGNNGGLVVEFADHLVMFEANGSAAATVARLDAANQLVPGKRVTALIVSHHHFDHTAGLRAAVARGLAVISHKGNEGILREMVGRPAVAFPDDLARNPQTLRFTPVVDRLVLEDKTQRLELYHVLGHPHMANAVFAYHPASRTLMEGDLGDADWTWHWWAAALATNLKAYGIAPLRNVAVHGPDGGLDISRTLANHQRQAEAARQFCDRQQAAGIPVAGCPVQFDATGVLPLLRR